MSRTLSGASAAGVTIVDQQTFTTSGTWTKPAGLLPSDFVEVDLWGGGGSGGIRVAGDTILGGPGGGGAHNRVTFRASELGATESVIVGAGGAAATGTTGVAVNGNAGGASSFRGHSAFGGGGGAGNNPYPGTGGGTLGPGATAQVNVRGGLPVTYTTWSPSYAATWSDANSHALPGEWGGANGGLSGPENRPIHGGGSGVNSNTAADRGSVWGGGAGGLYDGGNAGFITGGPSAFGGAGGNAVIPASSIVNVNGNPGAARGGGGSGAKWATTGTVTSGAGGRGEVVITVYRGR